MAWCHTAPSHHLARCWLITTVLGIIPTGTLRYSHWYLNYIFEIAFLKLNHFPLNLCHENYHKNEYTFLSIFAHEWIRKSLYMIFIMTSSDETFPASLVICAGNSPVTGEFPAQRLVTRNFDVFFNLRLNKRLSKQWRGWWFETPSRSLLRHCNICMNWFASVNYIFVMINRFMDIKWNAWWRIWTPAFWEPPAPPFYCKAMNKWSWRYR